MVERIWNHEPVRTMADLLSLDKDEIVRGYLGAKRGDPEPGANHTRAYHHGWRNRMIDMGEIENDAASQQLVHEVAPRGKMRAELLRPVSPSVWAEPHD